MDPRIIVCIVLLTANSSAPAQDPRRGVALYENHCTSCHDSVAHERKHRKADSWPALIDWVDRWQRHQELGWSPEDNADVAGYLDERFYRFGKRSSQ